jgi:hypothetical protein
MCGLFVMDALFVTLDFLFLIGDWVDLMTFRNWFDHEGQIESHKILVQNEWTDILLDQ